MFRSGGARAARDRSGDTRRRPDLAASLAGDPKVSYRDEPATGLDNRPAPGTG
jgi:ABC-type multidrug transport system ATPase subunit